jgi:tetratricopeptide (TPR) repeat protein
VRPRFERLVESLENALSARHPFSLLALGDYASWLHDQGEYELAYPVTSRLIEIADTVAPNHPKLRHAKVRFALELTRSTRLEEANRYYQEVLSNASNDLGVTLEAQLGHLWCSLAQGQTSEMAPLISKLIEQSQKRSGHEAAWCAYAVSRGSHCLGDFNNAKQYAAIALERAKACQPIPVNPLWLERLATIHATHDEFERAAELLRTAVDLERSMRPPKHPRLADKLLELGGCLQKQGKFDEAEPMLHEALNIYQIRMPKGDMRIESAKKRMESGAQSMVDRTDLNH